MERGVQYNYLLMNRFVRYWERYGFTFDDDLLAALYRHGRLQRYRRQEAICSPAMPVRGSFFVLSGIIEVQQEVLEQMLRPVDFIFPYQAFVGTKHLYTERYSACSYVCTKSADILQIDNRTLIRLSEQHRTLSEILHILKQRMIDRQQLLIELLRPTDKYQRFLFLQRNMPQWCETLPSRTLSEFLGVSRSTYFNYKKRWLWEK